MSKKSSNILSKSNIIAIQPAISSDIVKRYGENNAKAAIAERARYYSNEYLFNRPIGMAPNFRVSDLQKEMSEYVHKKFEEDSPKGFFFGLEFIAMAILSGVISWIIKRILDSLIDSYNEE